MKQIFFVLLVVVGVFSQCYMHTKCGDCLADTANTCVWCDSGSSGMCAASTCSLGTSVTVCPKYCTDFGKCDACTTTGASMNCSWCTAYGFSSCMVDSTCTASSGTTTPPGSCPPNCDAAPAPGTGNHCNLPSGYMIPSSASYPIMFNLCHDSGLGYNVTTSPSNCSDPCTVEMQGLPSTCTDAVMKISCLSICPTCDSNYDMSQYLAYRPCQSYCDDVVSSCNSLLSDACKLDVSQMCSNASTCSTATGVSYSGSPAKDCITASSTTSSTSSSDTGSTTASATDTGSTSSSSTTSGATNATTSTGATNSSKSSTTSATTSAQPTTGNGIILGFSFVAYLLSFLF